MNEFSNHNIILVGLGTKEKRIYMKLFKKYSITPKVIVDLKSKRKDIENYLEENNFSNVEIYLLQDEERDENNLSKETEEELKEIIKQREIKYAII